MSKFHRARRGWITDYRTAIYLKHQWEHSLQRCFIIELVGGPFSENWRVRKANILEVQVQLGLIEKSLRAYNSKLLLRRI